jgi:hypothetical protein
MQGKTPFRARFSLVTLFLMAQDIEIEENVFQDTSFPTIALYNF